MQLKNINYSLVLFMSALAFAMCTSDPVPKNKLIVGKWRVDSLNMIIATENTMIRADEKEKPNLGTISDPNFFQFTEFNEVYYYRQSDGGKRFDSYTVRGDTLDQGENADGKILSLTETNLVIQFEQHALTGNDPTLPKVVSIYYYTRVVDAKK